MKIETKYPEVFLEIDESSFYYKIIQVINGKFKVRGRVVGRPIRKNTKGNPKHDMFGNQLYNPFTSLEDSLQHGINFVNNFLKL